MTSATKRGFLFFAKSLPTKRKILNVVPPSSFFHPESTKNQIFLTQASDLLLGGSVGSGEDQRSEIACGERV